MKTIYFFGLFVLLISACHNTVKQISNTSDTSIAKINSELDDRDQSKTKSFPPDSFYTLLSGKYNFPDTIIKSMPINSSNYFSSIKFPFFFPKSLSIDYFCMKIPFELMDFYIFNKKNKTSACEYIALIDTNKFSKIIVRQCIDMENWIILYTISGDYRIIDNELLMNIGGDVDDIALNFDNKSIKYNDFTDSLKYENGVYQVSRSDIYSIKQESGKRTSEIGYQTIKTLKVKQNGEILRSDSVSIKKNYIEKYQQLNSYRFK